MRACHGKLEQGKLVLEQKPLNYELLCCSAFIKMLMHTKSGAAEISSSSATPCAGDLHIGEHVLADVDLDRRVNIDGMN